MKGGTKGLLLLGLGAAFAGVGTWVDPPTFGPSGDSPRPAVSSGGDEPLLLLGNGVHGECWTFPGDGGALGPISVDDAGLTRPAAVGGFGARHLAMMLDRLVLLDSRCRVLSSRAFDAGTLPTQVVGFDGGWIVAYWAPPTDGGAGNVVNMQWVDDDGGLAAPLQFSENTLTFARAGDVLVRGGGMNPPSTSLVLQWLDPRTGLAGATHTYPKGVNDSASVGLATAGGVVMATWTKSVGLWGRRFTLDGTDLSGADEDFTAYTWLFGAGTRFVGVAYPASGGFVGLDGGRGPLVSFAFDGGAQSYTNVVWAPKPLAVGQGPLTALSLDPATLSPVSSLRPWFDVNTQVSPMWLPELDGGHVIWVDTTHGEMGLRARRFSSAGVPGPLEELVSLPQQPFSRQVRLASGGPRPLVVYEELNSWWVDTRSDGTLSLSALPVISYDFGADVVGTPQSIYVPQRMFDSPPLETLGAALVLYDGGFSQLLSPLRRQFYEQFAGVARPPGVFAAAGGFNPSDGGSGVDIALFEYDGGVLSTSLNDGGFPFNIIAASSGSGACVTYVAGTGLVTECLRDDLSFDRAYQWAVLSVLNGFAIAWDGKETHVLLNVGTDGGAVTQWHRLFEDGGEETWVSPRPAVRLVALAPGRFVQAYSVQLDAGLNAVRADFFGISTQGTACVEDDDCRTGFCVDGVCCESRCGGGAADCLACATSAGGATDGVCTPIASCSVDAGTDDGGTADAGAPDAGPAASSTLAVHCGCDSGTAAPTLLALASLLAFRGTCRRTRRESPAGSAARPRSRRARG